MALALLLARVRPVRAALAALLVGVAAAVLVMPAPVGRLAEAEGRALLTGVEVAAIVLGGLLLAELLDAGGAQERIGTWLAGISQDRGRDVLLVVLGVTPFVESVTGFGVGAIVTTPLLRRMGFRPAQAAVLALLGFVAVPWGALAPGTLVASRLTGLGFQELGVASAVLSLPVFLVAGGAALAVGVGASAVVRRLPELLAVAVALWAGIWLANLTVGTPLAGALGSLVAVAVTLGLVWLRERRVPSMDGRVGRALLPYLVLIVLLLGSQALAAVLAGGQPEAWASVVASPAVWLLATAAATPWLLGTGPGAVPPALGPAVRRWWPVAVTTICFLALGGLMTASGMSALLAQTAARLGRGYLLLAPWIGGVGGFLTGSNAGANAMFAAAQAEAARGLDLPPLRLVAVQNVSASLLTMASAPRVALVAGLLGGVGTQPVRRLLLVDAAALVVLGLLAFTAFG